MNRSTISTIRALDFAIEDRGMDADPVGLLLLAHAARDLGVTDVLVSVMIDDSEPEPARVRAYARVAVEVADRMSPSLAAHDTRELQPAC